MQKQFQIASGPYSFGNAFSAPKVPAPVCERLKRAALAEAGQDDGRPDNVNNAHRNALRNTRKLGMLWNIKQATFEFADNDGNVFSINYLPVENVVGYLLRNHPETLCGTPTLCQAEMSCQVFWTLYQHHHSGHEVFTNFPEAESWKRIVPLCLHGDEGRGKAAVKHHDNHA